MSICAGWILLWVAAYWCLTLLGWQFLAPVMTNVRRSAVSVGAVGLVAALVWAEPGEPGWIRGVPLALGLLATMYSWRNQWLFPKPATELHPSTLVAADEELVAVLSNGRAVCISLLSKARTAVFEDQLIVHCGLARSLAAFKREGNQRPGAVLPHRTGFFIGADSVRWDGVDGSAAQGEDSLQLLPLLVVSYKTWRQAHPEGILLAFEGLQALPQPRTRQPHLPDAASIEDPLAWGRVEGESWQELCDEELHRAEPVDLPRRYLGRWAARARGLQTLSRGESAASANASDSG